MCVGDLLYFDYLCMRTEIQDRQDDVGVSDFLYFDYLYTGTKKRADECRCGCSRRPLGLLPQGLKSGLKSVDVGARNNSKDTHGGPFPAQKFIIIFPWIGTPFLQKFFRATKVWIPKFMSTKILPLLSWRPKSMMS